MIFPRDGKINSVCMRCPSKGKIKSLKRAGVSNSDLTAPTGVANDLFFVVDSGSFCAVDLERSS